jgi:hypothetical protein
MCTSACSRCVYPVPTVVTDPVSLRVCQVILTPPSKSPEGQADPSLSAKEAEEHRSNLQAAIRLAEKYFDRFSSVAFLDLLPHDTPLSLLGKYLAIVIEFADNKKKNLQIVYQLLRVREVNIKTAAQEP